MAGSLPRGKDNWPSESRHAPPGRARLHSGFAESADLLSPQARLGGDRKEFTARLGHCSPISHFQGTEATKSAGSVPGDRLAGTRRQGCQPHGEEG